MILMLGDCLTRMCDISDGSVDMILCDLPYGTTDCSWDSIIPFEPLWEQYWRVLKPKGAVVLTAVQPFTTKLISSQMDKFRYCWYWEKPKGANFALTGYQPLKVIEDVVVFSKSAAVFTKAGTSMNYYPQKIALEKPYSRDHSKSDNQPGFMKVRGSGIGKREYTHSTPRNLIYASVENNGRIHPTQKPVALMEYLIRTYTQEGETVLDNCMGSGTSGVACINSKRNFIGIEKDEKYFKLASERIEVAQLPEPLETFYE